MVFKTEQLHNMQKKQKRSTTVLKEILPDLHQHPAILTWLIQEHLIPVKKKSRPTQKIQQKYDYLYCRPFNFVYSNSKKKLTSIFNISLTATRLPHAQLWTTIEGIASLIQR